MENIGSSIIASLGAGSGVNFIQLAEDIASASYAFQRDNLSNRIETLEAKISAASLLRSSLNELASALGDRVRNGDLAPQASIGDPSIASVGIAAGATPSGSFSLEVTQLAQAQTLVSKSYSSGSDFVGEGTLNIRFGTADGANFTEDASRAVLEIAVTADDTLETLAGKISSASGGAIEAYVAQGTGGAQLVLKGEEGAANGFVLEGQSSAILPLSQPGDLSYLSWNPASDAGELRQASRDALFKLDTVEMRSAGNSVSGLPEGLSLDLKSTNIGSPTTISFANNTSAITQVMGDFVAALNDLAAQVNETAAAQGGALGNDPGARELKRDLARLTNEIVMPGAAEGEPRTLADLGLSFTREGTFQLDTARLNATLAESPEAAAAMFTAGPFGVFATIDNLARENASRSSPGSLGASVLRYEAQVERSDERLERVAEQQEKLRERLTNSLVAAERSISTSQSTLTFLEQQIDIWNSRN
ncbi:flagellar filament capping protein FliD [Erythrobacter sp. THAF29]|uniref:flagellar filament capping protein FliD n=1 Tax=Erythrobacter sp. THAF29 TaxID=2587851 RepID=UPI001268F453|nr:flagellar filament capping protein FliD [Erythrobacter sp. THAF29]QFT76719.1 Flagellar hook-associated protein 2 [Erythrobacter sp. THAF29]